MLKLSLTQTPWSVLWEEFLFCHGQLDSRIITNPPSKHRRTHVPESKLRSSAQSLSIFKQRAAGNINYVASTLLWSAFVASEKLISDGGPDVYGLGEGALALYGPSGAPGCSMKEWGLNHGSVLAFRSGLST